ncbi:MAG: hypothetical protein O3C57_04615, partial [Verrucomicrobia bacterium]|nr:hypothetical protein [Verrucomicrobiota bacterium]
FLRFFVSAWQLAVVWLLLSVSISSVHLPRPQHSKWLGPFAKNGHIAAADDIGIAKPILFDLESDQEEQYDLADKNPEVVKRLLELAEKGRSEIGDYDRIGSSQRFFDEGPRREIERRWLTQPAAEKTTSTP